MCDEHKRDGRAAASESALSRARDERPRPLYSYPHHAPREKLRGKRGYFRAVQDRASRFALGVAGPASWDLWHYHPDRRGWGNLGWSYRLPHIEALCTVFERIAGDRRRFDAPFQTWIRIDGEDSRDDATYLHTPGPNGARFPAVLEDIELGTSALGPVVEAWLPALKLRVGWSRTSMLESGEVRWSTAHWVWAEGVGSPLVES